VAAFGAALGSRTAILGGGTEKHPLKPQRFPHRYIVIVSLEIREINNMDFCEEIF
jgi:hypothetical protein